MKDDSDEIPNRIFIGCPWKNINRPRKCLGYKTPTEVFNRLCERRGVALRF
jgi:hypothetical protein